MISVPQYYGIYINATHKCVSINPPRLLILTQKYKQTNKNKILVGSFQWSGSRGLKQLTYLLRRASSADCRASSCAILADSCVTITVHWSVSSERFTMFGVLSAEARRRKPTARARNVMLMQILTPSRLDQLMLEHSATQC